MYVVFYFPTTAATNKPENEDMKNQIYTANNYIYSPIPNCNSYSASHNITAAQSIHNKLTKISVNIPINRGRPWMQVRIIQLLARAGALCALRGLSDAGGATPRRQTPPYAHAHWHSDYIFCRRETELICQ